MNKVKILLVSDLHLGMERINPLITGEERLSTFRKIISLAHKHDILLIAGDLVHDINIENRYVNIIKEEFSSLLDEGREIYYTPGCGELNSLNRLNYAITEIPTTFTFSDDYEQFMIKSSKGDIYIYGLQCKSQRNGWNITRADNGGFHIGLFHADFNPQISGGPDIECIKKDDIKRMNLDFYALGRNHSFKMFRLSNIILGAYPGSAEPCSIDESGDRFAVSIDIEDNTLQNIKRIAVNTGKIISDEIDCGTLISQDSLYEKMRSNYPDRSIVNITFTGERDFLIENNFKEELSDYFRGLKITDLSLPTLKVMIEENIRCDSLKGVFFRTLNEAVSSDNNRFRNETLAEIISQKKRSANTGGAVLCDF